MKGNEESFGGLANDATSLITILTYWSSKEGIQLTEEIKESLKNLQE